jgi:hypothetical protein
VTIATRARGAPYDAVILSDSEGSAVPRVKSKPKSSSFAMLRMTSSFHLDWGRQNAAKRLLPAKTNIRVANFMLKLIGWG